MRLTNTIKVTDKPVSKLPKNCKRAVEIRHLFYPGLYPGLGCGRIKESCKIRNREFNADIGIAKGSDRRVYIISWGLNLRRNNFPSLACPDKQYIFIGMVWEPEGPRENFEEIISVI